MKLKISLITLSIAVLTFIPLMRNNFGAPITLKRWAPLSWDDFQGIARPFSAYAAAINSFIYLEYDSIKEKYTAFAVQNNQKSWVKNNLHDADYVLNHEQYHFNISEVHARKLNQVLDSLGGQDPFELLGSHRFDLNVLQNRFDDETDHGRRIGIQKKWEYQIDSMLRIYETDSIFTRELYSGANVFFPIEPMYGEDALENGAFKNYSIYRYNMNISFICYILQDQQNMNFDKLIDQKSTKDSLIVQTVEERNSIYGEMIVLNAIDTATRVKEISHWHYCKPYIYELYTDYPWNEHDSIGYEQIANSFFNSFSISNTDSYFLSKINDTKPVSVSKLQDNSNQKLTKGACMTYLPSNSQGFFRGPIYNERGDMLMALDIIQHEDSLLLRNVLVINDNMYDSKVSNMDQLLIVPKYQIPEGDYWMSLGYFLLEDTANTCYNYYNQSIHIRNQALLSAESSNP